jgi:hypothetical protein
MGKLLTGLKWILVWIIVVLAFPLLSFFTNLIFLPNIWPQESWDAAKPMMFGALCIFLVSGVGLIIVLILHKKISKEKST